MKKSSCLPISLNNDYISILMNMLYDPRESFQRLRVTFLTLAIAAAFGVTPRIALADIDEDFLFTNGNTSSSRSQMNGRQQGMQSTTRNGRALYKMRVGETKNFSLKGTAETINVETPDVVELFLPEPGTLSITGVDKGVTTLAIRYEDGSINMLGVIVSEEGEIPADILLTRLETALGSVDGLSLEVREGKVLITGTADTRNKNYYKQVVGLFRDEVISRVRFTDEMISPAASDMMVASNIAQPDDMTPSTGIVQVDVKIVDVNLDRAKHIGVSWFNTGTGAAFNGDYGVQSGDGATSPGGGGSRLSVGGLLSVEDLDAKLRFLVNRSAARLLATPKLVVASGETASFNVGGEIPIVRETNENFSVEYKKFGTLLEVTPVIMGTHYVDVHVKSTLSSIDENLVVGSSNMPAFKNKDADTRLTVKSGTTFALAGLIQQEESNSHSKLPVLGDVPGLSLVFKNKSRSFTTTETLVLMTPYLVTDVDNRLTHDKKPMLGSESIIDVLNAMDGNLVPEDYSRTQDISDSGAYEFDEHEHFTMRQHRRRNRVRGR